MSKKWYILTPLLSGFSSDDIQRYQILGLSQLLLITNYNNILVPTFDFRKQIPYLFENKKIDDELFCLDKTKTTEEYIETGKFIILGTQNSYFDENTTPVVATLLGYRFWQKTKTNQLTLVQLAPLAELLQINILWFEKSYNID